MLQGPPPSKNVGMTAFSEGATGKSQTGLVYTPRLGCSGSELADHRGGHAAIGTSSFLGGQTGSPLTRPLTK